MEGFKYIFTYIFGCGVALRQGIFVAYININRYKNGKCTKQREPAK